jgi:outer membrane protein assembly factor BamA
MIYVKDIAKNYFGLVGQPMAQDVLPDFSSYNENLREKNKIQKTTNAFYDKYHFEEPAINASAERDLLDSRLRALVGISLREVVIKDYTNSQIPPDEFSGYKQNKTRLRKAYNQDQITGFHGGTTNYARLGLALDTRDFEPDPSSGLFIESAADFCGGYTFSDFDFIRLTIAPKYYFSPFEDIVSRDNIFHRFVIASRFLYSFVDSGDAPFWVYNEISSSPFAAHVGYLGGLRSLRGFKSERFVGQSLNLLNFELRWTFFDFNVKEQHFAFIIVPFVDIGQANEGIKFGVDDLKTSYGAGLRIPWNQATIIMLDLAFSAEDTNFYINFGHIF